MLQEYLNGRKVAEEANPEAAGLPEPARKGRPPGGRAPARYWALLTLLAFLGGLAGGYFLGERGQAGRAHDAPAAKDLEELARQVNPPEGYALPARFGEIGPRLLEAGALDYAAFAEIYRQAGQPLSEAQQAILTEGSGEPVVFDRRNAYFLLNFFWAFGLANANPILTEGPMMQYGKEGVTRFASTGGWSVAARPIAELYAGAAIVTLSAEQQERLEEVASSVYRPCCNNPTHFPDCNHGMAMLGLLELMASQDFGEEAMFEAAKYANAFWYPNQMVKLAAFFKASREQDFSEVDPRQLLGPNYSSQAGFRQVNDWLAANGLLEPGPGGGSSCGV